MHTKKKHCKGGGKAINYGCGELNYPFKYGLCKRCYPKWLYNTDVGLEMVERASFKAHKQAQSKVKKETIELKNSLKDWKKELQTVINHIARIIDKGQTCLAKGIMAKQIHGGHIYSKGSHSNIRFNLHNIHRQSAQSNHFQNEDGLLREGLLNEYGQSYFDFVSGLRATPQIKLSNEQYKEKHTIALSIRKTLLKENKEYSKEERIKLRNKINLELTIYSEEFCIFVTQ